MEIEEQVQGAVTILRPQGPLLGDHADKLKDRALVSIRTHMGRLVIDASEMTYTDSRGLETLLDLSEEVSSSGRLLKLCGLNDTLREVLDLTDLASLFDLYADTNTAVRSFL